MIHLYLGERKERERREFPLSRLALVKRGGRRGTLGPYCLVRSFVILNRITWRYRALRLLALKTTRPASLSTDVSDGPAGGSKTLPRSWRERRFNVVALAELTTFIRLDYLTNQAQVAIVIH